MIFWLIPVVAVPVAIWCVVMDGERGRAAVFLGLQLSVPIAVVLAFVLGLIGWLTTSLVEDYDETAAKTTVESEKQEIVALADNFGAAGSFFLGYGSIDGGIYYSYAVEQNGLRTIKTMKGDGVWIDESGKTQPCIEYVTTTIATPLVDPEHFVFKLFWLPSNVDTEHKTIIHIPPGSMTTDFNIDLK